MNTATSALLTVLILRYKEAWEFIANDEFKPSFRRGREVVWKHARGDQTLTADCGKCDRPTKARVLAENPRIDCVCVLAVQGAKDAAAYCTCLSRMTFSRARALFIPSQLSHARAIVVTKIRYGNFACRNAFNDGRSEKASRTGCCCPPTEWTVHLGRRDG